MCTHAYVHLSYLNEQHVGLCDSFCLFVLKKRNGWEDNIKEWTGLEWNIILRKAENRKAWGKLVVKSQVVPQ